jgi:hypothetical protein
VGSACLELSWHVHYVSVEGLQFEEQKTKIKASYTGDDQVQLL